MTPIQAKAIVNDLAYIDAVLFYRRKPIETFDETFRLAQLWIEAEFILSNIDTKI